MGGSVPTAPSHAAATQVRLSCLLPSCFKRSLTAASSETGCSFGEEPKKPWTDRSSFTPPRRLVPDPERGSCGSKGFMALCSLQRSTMNCRLQESQTVVEEIEMWCSMPMGVRRELGYGCNEWTADRSRCSLYIEYSHLPWSLSTLFCRRGSWKHMSAHSLVQYLFRLPSSLLSAAAAVLDRFSSPSLHRSGPNAGRILRSQIAIRHGQLINDCQRSIGHFSPSYSFAPSTVSRLCGKDR